MKSLLVSIFSLFIFNLTLVKSQEIGFSHRAGFYQGSFLLELTTQEGFAIFYTLDCSSPGVNHGSVYQSALSISETTIVRAVAIATSGASGTIYTQSYLFPEDIIRQNNSPMGYPSQWGPYTALSGKAKADYEMDPELLNNGDFAIAVKNSFLQSPSVSLVTDRENLFSSELDSVKGGIYLYTGAPVTNFTYAEGRGWERPASVEFFEIDTTFQVNCGVRIQGGHSRRPEKNPKHSFLLEFDADYGLSKLNYPYFGKGTDGSIENIILKSGFGNTWLHHDNTQRIRATYQEDVWAKDTQRAMGHPSANTRYVHLFLNGMYWGMYIPSERMDKEFGEHYFGGDEDDYDVIKDYTEVADGVIDDWNKMMSMANAGLESEASYLAIQGKKMDGSVDYDNESLVDLVNLADYMLLNFFGGNSDWDHHNWAAMRNRTNPGKGFKFLSWDAELIFGTLTVNVLAENNANCPSRVYQQLIKNDAFKRLFADRIQKHCFNDGVFTPDSAAYRWQKRKDELSEMLQAESARWGDYRRDVHPYQTAGPFALYTRDNHWASRQEFIQQTIFPQRNDQFISQLRSAGLFPEVDAPTFKINNSVKFSKEIESGDLLTLSVSQGTIYYNLNGDDPVDWETSQLSNAISYTEPIQLSGSCQLVARTFYNGKWSAALRRSFILPQEMKNIKLTEIQYKPLAEIGQDNEEYEFIELKNRNQSVLDLSGLYFDSGVDFTFPVESKIKPGEFIVLSSNSSQFLSRYGFRSFAEYKGKLNNAGETLTLKTGLDSIVFSVSYNSNLDWPQEADGKGYSLVPTNQNPTGLQNNPSDWRASSRIGGSPGEDDSNSITNLENAFVLKDKYLVIAYPTMFKDQVFIDVNLPATARVSLEIYSLSGQLVKTIENQSFAVGLHQFVWDGTNTQNTKVQPGVYLYKLHTNLDSRLNFSTGKLVKVQ